METIGKNVKRLRGERKWTQEELAERLNVSAQAISKWENGSGLPDISQVVPLANVFGVSTDVLFGLEGTDESERAAEMIRDAYALQEYGKCDTYFRSYDRLTAGLKKYPSNCALLNACMECGLSLSLTTPERAGTCTTPRERRKLPTKRFGRQGCYLSMQKTRRSLCGRIRCCCFCTLRGGITVLRSRRRRSSPNERILRCFPISKGSTRRKGTPHMRGSVCAVKSITSCNRSRTA